MKQSELDYKQETGLAASRVERVYDEKSRYEYETVPYDEYIEWLEEKYEGLKKEIAEVCIDWKSEYDDAVNEIGQLQEQLEEAQYEIKELTGDR